MLLSTDIWVGALIRRAGRSTRRRNCAQLMAAGQRPMEAYLGNSLMKCSRGF
jgi:hypothetical protein